MYLLQRQEKKQKHHTFITITVLQYSIRRSSTRFNVLSKPVCVKGKLTCICLSTLGMGLQLSF